MFEDPRTLDRLAEEVDAPRLVHVYTTIQVYDRGEDDGPLAAERLDDIHVLIDVDDQVRIVRGEGNREAFDELVGEADAHVEIPIRCSRAQLPILLSEATLVMISGASRSGKSEVAQRRLIRAWLLKGGRGKLIWIMGPELRACYIALEKLLIGREGKPPALPTTPLGRPMLASRWPASRHAKDLRTVLIDGTVVDLRPLDRAGGQRIRGESLIAGNVTEATAVRDKENLVEAVQRVSEEDGYLTLDTTPDPPHYLEDTKAAGERALEEEARGGPPAEVAHFALDRYTNVWVPSEKTRREEEKIRNTMGEAAVRRHIYGEWVAAGGGRFWVHWQPEKMVLAPHEGEDLGAMTGLDGQVFLDVTDRAVRGFTDQSDNWFIRGLRATNLRYIGGLDVNQRPQVMPVVKVFATRATIGRPDAWGIVVMDEVGMSYAGSLRAFADYAKDAARGRYRGIMVVADPQNCHKDRDIRAGRTGRHGGNEAAKAMADVGFDVRPAATAWSPGGVREMPREYPWSPPVEDSHELVQRLMYEGRLYVHPRCARTLEAFERQQQDERAPRRPLKGKNDSSDRLSHVPDGIRYAVWRLFGPSRKGPTPRNELVCGVCGAKLLDSPTTCSSCGASRPMKKSA